MSSVIGNSREPALRTPTMAPIGASCTSLWNALREDSDDSEGWKCRNALRQDAGDSAGWKCTDTLCVPPPLPVVVSGQLCMVETSQISTLFSLDAAVRKTLEIEAPVIRFFDIDSRELQTDAMLHSAISEGLFPFCGKASEDGKDASGQIEDMSRMQRKIIQAQMAVIMTKVETNKRKLGDIEDHLEKSATYIHTLFTFFSERLDVMSSLVKEEKQVQESGIHLFTRQFQEMSELLKTESETRRREAEGYMALLSEIRAQVDDNKQEISFDQQRQGACTVRLDERLDEMVMRGGAGTSASAVTSQVWDSEQQSAGSRKCPIGDMSSEASNFELPPERQDARTRQRDGSKRIVFETSSGSTATIDVDLVNSQIVGPSPSAANRSPSLASTVGIHMNGAKCETMASLASGLDRVFQAMEMMRLEQKQVHTQVQDSLAQMGDLGVCVGAEVRELVCNLVQQERNVRDEQIIQAWKGVNDQQTKLITDMEQKLVDKFEHKLMQRESVVKGAVTEALPVLNTFSSKSPVAPVARQLSPSQGKLLQSSSILTDDVVFAGRSHTVRPAIARQPSSSQGNLRQSSSVVSLEEHIAEQVVSSGSCATLISPCRVSVPPPSSARNPHSARALSPRGSLVTGAAGPLSPKQGTPQSSHRWLNPPVLVMSPRMSNNSRRTL